MTPLHTNIYRFPVCIGERMTDNDLVAVGGEGGWVTRLSCTENRRAVLEGIHFFKARVPKDPVYLALIQNKLCMSFFEGLHLDTNHALTHGLFVTLHIRSNSHEDCEEMRAQIEKEIRFFITGGMEVTWHKSDIRGTADYPQITNFSINKFGYFTIGSRPARIVFDIP